jgi:signal transduction histidine kinase
MQSAAESIVGDSVSASASASASATAASQAGEGADAVAGEPAAGSRTRWQRLWFGYSGWVLLNTAVLALSLVLELIAWAARGGDGSRVACGVIAAGVIVLGAVWLWMAGPGRGASDSTCRRLARIAGGVSVLIAVVVSRLSPVGDVPGAIIALPALVAVAVHERAIYAVLLAVVIALFTLLPARVFVHTATAAQLAAAFNAAGLALAGVVVVLVVSLFTSALRRETRRLRDSLAELRATRAQLIEQESLAAVGRLAAGIAHEIRNPVAMIASSLEMAAQDSTHPDTRAEMSSVARQEAARLTTLTNDFLAYARGKPLERQDVALEDVTGYVVSLIRARAVERGVSLLDRATPGLRAILDPFQLHHAVLNLATNALDATPPNGTVTVGAAPLDDVRFDLFVENTTADALPPDVVDRLFEPFFSTKPQGTGLGLPIARRIAQAHGGEVLLTRNEPGRVRFTLRLPRGAPVPGESITPTEGEG